MAASENISTAKHGSDRDTPGVHTSVSEQELDHRLWKLFLGLSRTPHGLLDVATPAMAALLCLGHFPAIPVIVVGLITAFAGYNAVYALNDLIDYSTDCERISLRERSAGLFHMDEVLVRHPIAQGLLSFRLGLIWCIAWSLVAVLGSFWLNPLCVVIFGASVGFEALYCRLLRITHLKVIPSAIVKASGGLAGIIAVDANPSSGFVAILLLWLAAWEIGGQNVANDIIDREDDLKVNARTTATVKGVPESVFRVVVAVSMACFGGVSIYWLAGAGVGILYPIGALVLGWYLLIAPARRLYFAPSHDTAAQLFNRASYLPVCFLVLTGAAILITP